MKDGDTDRPDVFRIGSWKSIITGLVFSIIFGYFVFGPLGYKVNSMINEPIVDGKFFIEILGSKTPHFNARIQSRFVN